VAGCGAVGDIEKEHELDGVFTLLPLKEGDSGAVRHTQRGVLLLHEGRTDEALRELHAAKQLAPNSHQVFSNLGCAYHERGNDNEARSWFEEAHKLNPRDETATLALALLEQQRGQVEEAQWLLVHFLQEVDSSHIGALRQLGRLHMIESNWAQAAGCYRRLIVADPSNRDWPAKLAICQDRLPADQAVVLPGQQRGGTRSIAGFTDDSTRASVTGDTRSSMGRSSTGGAGAAMTGAAAASLRNARNLRDSNQSNKALDVYRGILRTTPANMEEVLLQASLGVVDCMCDLSQFGAACEAAKQLLSLKPDSPEANLRMAEVLLTSGRPADMAEPYLQRARQDPAASEGGLKQRLLCATAEAALMREDYAKAMSTAAEAVRLDASSPRALLLLGVARLQVAEYDKALRSFGAAIEACAGMQGAEASRIRSAAHMRSGQVQERQRQYPQALAQVKLALDMNPNLALAKVVQAQCMQQMGRAMEAENELSTVLRRDPQNALALLTMGYFQLCKGDPRAAKTLEAVLGSPSGSRSIVGTAKVYLALALDASPGMTQGRTDQLLKEALALHSNLAQVWHEIEGGLATQPVAAVQRLRGICDLDLTSMQAKQLLALLGAALGRGDVAQAARELSSQDGGGRGRQTSVPPNRWGPGGPRCESMMVSSSSSRHGTPMRGRASSRDPSPSGGSFAALGGAGSRAGSFYGGNRGGSPLPRGADPLELDANEVILPQDLQFGPQLGAGGSAQVFRGSFRGQEVAIKKISGLTHLEAMKKEILALRRLRHPRLVRFIGACIQPPLLLVLTEFMPGGSLHDRLFGKNAHRPLMPTQKFNISVQMAEGLSFLHAWKVVHRDLKSMNILLDGSGNAKICDFGLAQQMEATHMTRKQEGEGGSPRYMAPECFNPTLGNLTEKIDIWAMGCILIEVFGGILPYHDCQTMAQLSVRITLEQRPPDIPAAVPAAVAALIKRCTVFVCDRRISAVDLQQELSRISRDAVGSFYG